MLVEKRDGSRERKILIGMVVNDGVLGRIAQKWEKEAFQSKWCNIVGDWCVKFYQKYDKAPGKSIEGIFESWAEKNADKETVRLVDKFLTSLSGEYEDLDKDINASFLLDMAGEHFNRVKILRLAESMEGDIEIGKIDDALKRIADFGKVEMGVGAGVNVLTDEEAIKRALSASSSEVLVKYKGALGHFYGDALARDNFIVFEGPEKRGKTWQLLDLAWRGISQQRRVAFFEVGDLSEAQIMRRFMVRATKHPLKPTEKGKPIRYPNFISYSAGADFAEVTHDDLEFDKSLDHKAAIEACKQIVQKQGRGDLLRLSCHPSLSINVAGITNCLRNWERDGWVPDILCIDYVDILAPNTGYKESRDQINATWASLRGLNLSLHCLLVTATQSDAASYTTRVITQANFSNDKRKNAHATGIVGINQDMDYEKPLGLQRLNWVVLRESDFDVNKCVHVAGCLGLANPCVKSTF